MATTANKGTNYTIVESPTPSTMFSAAKWAGKLRAQCDTFTSAVQIDAGSTIKVARLKKGSVPLAIMVSTAGLGAAVTLKIGDGTTADLFVAAGGITDLTSASQQFKVFAAAAFGNAKELTADTDIVATTEDQNFAAEKTIETAVIYAAVN